MGSNIDTHHIVYQIKSGDNLTRIALRFGVTPEEIAAVGENNISNVNNIDSGATLYIPTQKKTHVVKKGDTGWAIANKYGFTLQELEQVAENKQFIDVAQSKGTSPFSVLEVGDVISFPHAALTLSDGSSMIAPPRSDAEVHNGSGRAFGDRAASYTDQLRSEESLARDEALSSEENPDIDSYPELYESEGDYWDTSVNDEAEASQGEDFEEGLDYLSSSDECVDEEDGLVAAEAWYDSPDYELYSEDEQNMSVAYDDATVPWYSEDKSFSEGIAEVAVSQAEVENVPQILVTTLTPTDPLYLSKVLEEIQASSHDFLSDHLQQLRTIANTKGEQSAEYADIRQRLRADLQAYAPQDSSLLLFLDTLIDMQELNMESLVSYAQKTDEIFSAFSRDSGFTRASRGSHADKTEFVFSFLKERVTEQEDAFRFGAENTSHLEVGMEHLLALVNSEQAESIGYCSVCAQNIGMILARFNVPVSYHYGYVTEHVQFGEKTREGFVPDEGQEEPVPSKASSELHVWLEVDGVEWEATSLRPVSEMVSRAFLFRNRRASDNRTIGYKRIDHYEYTDTSGAVGMVENAMGMAQNASMILEEQRVGEYEALWERLPLGIQEDPELVELYQYAGKVGLEMARNKDVSTSSRRSPEEVQALYAQSCRYYAQGIEKAQAYTTRKSFIKQGLLAALHMANNVQGERMQTAGLRRILRLASEYLEPHEFGDVIAAQSQGLPVTNGVLYAHDMLRLQETDSYTYRSVWSIDEQNHLMTCLYRAAEGVDGFQHWAVLATVFEKHSKGNHLWHDGPAVVASAQEHAGINLLADASE